MKFDLVKPASELREAIKDVKFLTMEVEHANYFLSYKRQIIVIIRDGELHYVNEFFTHKHKDVKGAVNRILNCVTGFFIKYENYQWVVYKKGGSVEQETTGHKNA